MSDQYDVVLILLDDMTGNMLDSQGNVLLDSHGNSFMPWIKANVIDRGMRFPNTFVEKSLCAVSRASIDAGRSYHNTGVIDNNGPDGGYQAFSLIEGNVLPVWAKNSGRRVGHSGKKINGDEKIAPTHVFPGHDFWRCDIDDVPNANYVGCTFYESNDGGATGASHTYTGEYIIDTMTRQALEFLDGMVPGQRFYLNLSPVTPHTPAVPSVTYAGAYASEPFPFFSDPSFNLNPMDQLKPSEMLALPLLTQNDIDGQVSFWRKQCECVRSADDMVHAVVEKLRDKNRLNNTYIIVTSDNGLAHGQLRLMGKDSTYLKVLRVPLYIRGPGIPEGVTCNKMVSNLDLAATICDMAGITVPPGYALDGKSMRPLFADPVHADWRSAMLVASGDAVGVITKSTSGFGLTDCYAEWNSGGREYNDLVADPDQLANKINKPANQARIAALASMLASLKTCAGSTCWEP